tara:strand:+ start:105 stop:419 length:315 start_codon:yes stop_codon:yes gene_type:complete
MKKYPKCRVSYPNGTESEAKNLTSKDDDLLVLNKEQVKALLVVDLTDFDDSKRHLKSVIDNSKDSKELIEHLEFFVEIQSIILEVNKESEAQMVQVAEEPIMDH